MRGERDIESLAAEERGIARCVVPRAQGLKGHREPVVILGELRHFREIHGDDEGRRGGSCEIRTPPLLACGEQDRLERQLAGKLPRAIDHQHRRGLKDHRHRFARGGLEGVERSIEGGTRTLVRMRRKVGEIRRLKLRVEEGLPHRRDHAHERVRIRIGPLGILVRLFPLRHIERHVLESVRANDRLIRISRSERHKHTRAPDHAAIRHHIRRREPFRAQGLQRLLFRRILPRHPPLRQHE